MSIQIIDRNFFSVVLSCFDRKKWIEKRKMKENEKKAKKKSKGRRIERKEKVSFLKNNIKSKK